MTKKKVHNLLLILVFLALTFVCAAFDGEPSGSMSFFNGKVELSW